MEMKSFRLRSSPNSKSRSVSLEDGQDADCTLALHQKILQQDEEDKAWAEADAKGYGEKSISFWGSCALNFNNIAGPAMVVLPLLYQQAGWLLPSLALLGLWALSCVASSMLCEAMQRIPGNASFGRRYEYCTLVRHYLGNRCYYAAMVGFNAGLVASNIAAMIVVAQVLDALVSRTAGFTMGFSYGKWPPQLLVDSMGGSTELCPWGTTASGACSTSVITLGYFVAAGMCIPLGLLSLGGNMGLQWVSAAGQLLFSLHFIIHYLQVLPESSPQFCPGNGPSRTPVVGGDVSQVMGLALFSFSYVSTIPSWVNEKRGGVPVNRALWIPSLAAVSLNMTLAVLGAWSFRLLSPSGHPIRGTENILSVLVGRAGPESYCNNTQQVPVQVQVAVYAWGLCGYLPGIPVLAIMVRYNLLNAKVMGPRGAFLTAVVLPWVVTAFFYKAEVLVQFCNWVAILCQGVVNFVVPPLLYRAALLAYPTPPSPLRPDSSKPLFVSPTQAARSPPGFKSIISVTDELSPLSRESGGRKWDGGEWSSGGTEPLIPKEGGAVGRDETEQPAEVDVVPTDGRADGRTHGGKGGGESWVGNDGAGRFCGGEVTWQAEEQGRPQDSPGDSSSLQQTFVQEADVEGAARGMVSGDERTLSRLQGDSSPGSSLSGLVGGEDPVDALPAWLGIDPLKSATCMALGLSILVVASIICAVVNAIRT